MGAKDVRNMGSPLSSLRNVNPVPALPCARRSIAGLNPNIGLKLVPSIKTSGTPIRSTNKSGVEGVLNARLYVNRRVLNGLGLMTSAARGEKNRSSIWLCLSIRPATTRSI